MCVGCRQRAPRNRLLRFVATKDGALIPDVHGRLPGRGAHVCPDLRCFRQAERNQAFTRIFHRAARFDDPARSAIVCASTLHQEALAALARCVRRGTMLCGDCQTRAALPAGALSLILCAADASSVLIQRYQQEAARYNVPLHTKFTLAELSLVTGDQNSNVVGIFHRGTARRLDKQLSRASRLLDSMHPQNNQFQRHLTATKGFEMMPLVVVAEQSEAHNHVSPEELVVVAEQGEAYNHVSPEGREISGQRSDR